VVGIVLWAAATRGRLAQLVERLVYTEKVGGSRPSSPTIFSMAYREIFSKHIKRKFVAVTAETETNVG
jgi:hypothetical protein